MCGGGSGEKEEREGGREGFEISTNEKEKKRKKDEDEKEEEKYTDEESSPS